MRRQCRQAVFKKVINVDYILLQSVLPLRVNLRIKKKLLLICLRLIHYGLVCIKFAVELP